MDEEGPSTELLTIPTSEMGCGHGSVAKHENTLSVSKCELMPGS